MHSHSHKFTNKPILHQESTAFFHPPSPRKLQKRCNVKHCTPQDKEVTGACLTLESYAFVCIVGSSDSVQGNPLPEAPVATPGQVIALCLPTWGLLLHTTLPALQPACIAGTALEMHAHLGLRL